MHYAKLYSKAKTLKYHPRNWLECEEIKGKQTETGTITRELGRKWIKLQVKFSLN